METFKHVIPTKEYEKEAFEYINEFYQYNSDINGTGGLQRFMNDYDGWLQKLEDDRLREPSNDKVPAETYFLIRESDNRIVGMLNFRLTLNDRLRRFGGHIGYSIRPTERRKGYNKINLYLGLLEAQKRNIDRVMLDCDENNIGSDKTLQALGGELERIEKNPTDGEVTKVYWFSVDECVDKYKDIYTPYISSSTRKK